MEIDPVPISSCSKENQKIYQEWFNHADADGDGRITGSDATKFFAMANLPREDLKQVWAVADSKRQGYLGFKEFIIAMQLVSLAQDGHPITQDVLTNYRLIRLLGQKGRKICLLSRQCLISASPGSHTQESQLQHSD